MLKISRQAVYQYSRRQHESMVDESHVIKQVQLIRRRIPRIGTRKLYERLQPMLQQLGIGRDQLFDILRRHRMLIKPRKRFVTTTNSRHAQPVYPNLLLLTKPDGPRQVLVADQTYLRLHQGFCYLSLVTDLYSRKILGADVSPTLEVAGPLRAVAMALVQIPDRADVIHHSDRGVQYCSSHYTALLTARGVQISMSAPGCPYDNAVAERVNGILKSEFFLDRTFSSIQQARQSVFEAITIYNVERPHLSLDMMTPEMKHAA